MNPKIFENEEIVVRIEKRTDNKYFLIVHKKANGIEIEPNGYVLGSNALLTN